FFIKVNAALFGLDMFEKEARGLIQLADTGAIKVPRPLFDGKFNQQIFLVIEYIDPGQPASGFWESFGRSLAQLHYNRAAQFGLDYNNYIGKLTQCNRQHNSWSNFYAEERILPLVRKAHEKGMLEPGHVAAAEHICSKLHTIFPEEQPSLLHGDLWNGNFIAGTNGEAAIFDPAIYFGHREMDIAMTLLFGGFDTLFYEAYEHHFALQPSWQQRVALCQLYPLLVHLLLFGGSYREKVIETLNQYK
ncbi:MAG TPA: fructosamine kinase family protein, partial [Agriterribacter sp.]|nr:fructosamine kinase family protein [Agriterribacter sp.]